jgi:hypothetical protein
MAPCGRSKTPLEASFSNGRLSETLTTIGRQVMAALLSGNSTKNAPMPGVAKRGDGRRSCVKYLYVPFFNSCFEYNPRLSFSDAAAQIPLAFAYGRANSRI